MKKSKLILPSKYYKPNILFRIWLFFMDSEKGAKQYLDECNEYAHKNPHMLIDFAPYPGRLKWREWKLVRKYQSWIWKKTHVRIPTEELNIIKRIDLQEIAPKLIGCQPMPTPTSPIFFLKWVKDEKEFKEGEGI